MKNCGSNPGPFPDRANTLPLSYRAIRSYHQQFSTWNLPGLHLVCTFWATNIGTCVSLIQHFEIVINKSLSHLYKNSVIKENTICINFFSHLYLCLKINKQTKVQQISDKRLYYVNSAYRILHFWGFKHAN